MFAPDFNDQKRKAEKVEEDSSGSQLVLKGADLIAHERMVKEYARQAQQIEDYQEAFRDMSEERDGLARAATEGQAAVEELSALTDLKDLPAPLRRFFTVMVWTYKKNLDKGGPPMWSGLTVRQGLEKVEEEHLEFIQAIADTEEPDRVVDEAADLALSSMITAHVYARTRKTDRVGANTDPS